MLRCNEAVREAAGIETDKKYVLFRLWCDEQLDVDVEDPPDGFVEELAATPQDAIDRLLAEANHWAIHESDRWLMTGTDLPDVPAEARPKEYLAAVEEQYENVIDASIDTILFAEGGGGPTVPRGMLEEMASRGRVVTTVAGNEVRFGVLDVDE